MKSKMPSYDFETITDEAMDIVVIKCDKLLIKLYNDK